MTPDQIKAARRELGMTQAQLAARLRLAESSGPRTVRHWESGTVPITGPASVAIELLVGLNRLILRGLVTSDDTRAIYGAEKQ